MGRPKSDEKLVPVMVRLAATEVERIDAERGDRSRSDYVRSALNTSGGARTTAPPVAPTGEAPTSSSPAPLDPSERPPSRRQQASAIVAAFQDAEDGVGRGWTHEEATYLFARFRAERDAWATYNKASIQWADAPPAPAEKPQRRQGTITRPADREPKRQAWADRPRTPVTMPLMPAPKIGKRHADDCSCLSCKAPKAVAK